MGQNTLFLLVILCNLFLLNCCAASAEQQDYSRGKSESISWLKRIADKSPQQSNQSTKNFKHDFRKIFAEDKFDINKLRKTSFEIMDSGIPSKVGYGFLMGYTSGIFLKKISRILAFAVGGTFVLLQCLSYQGYVSLNHDKLKSDVEGVFDINRDGIVDTNDASEAYTHINTILSYNMPTGGGFASGIMLGIRG